MTLGIFRRCEVRNSDFKIAIHEASQEREDFRANTGGKAFDVPRNVFLGFFRAGGPDLFCLGALVRWVAHFFPFVQQAGIDLPNHRAQI